MTIISSIKCNKAAAREIINYVVLIPNSFSIFILAP